MKLHLRSVVLWARTPSKEPRILHFEPGMVNVLTGNARTGKSALIPIIDYCLGASSCAIPKKVVRSSCAWFGIVIETEEGQKLLARMEPGEQDAVEDMFVMESAVVTIPLRITDANTEARHVKHRLDRLANLSHLDFAGGEASNLNFGARLGFRDLMAFVFQPQNVVANRDILFYRTDRLEYKRRLAENTLPYVLGAVTPEMLMAKYELDRLQREFRRKSRDLERAREASSRWEGEMAGYLQKAEEFGLISDQRSADTSPEAMLRLLKEVATKTVDDFKTDSSTISSAVSTLIDLEAEEDRWANELAELKSRQAELSRLREGAGGYRDALVIQRDRLAVSDWVAARSGTNSTCPICKGEMPDHSTHIAELQLQLRQIESAADKLITMPAEVDREVQDVRKRTDHVVEKLADIRRQKNVITSESEEARNRQFQSLSVAHFLGRLGQAISLYEEVQDKGELPQEIEELRAKIAEYSSKVDHSAIEKRQNAALDRVSHFISRFMPQLDNDHENDAARLVVEDLTLKISGEQGVSYLWSIGSGSNHLSYHVATILALHSFFLDAKTTSVPGLLILDQPSQVYFPEKIRRGDTPVEQPSWTDDEDIAAVRKLFKLLGQVTESLKGKFQVIVLDHAPDDVWGNISSVTLVEDWHTGEKLVPQDWLVQ